MGKKGMTKKQLKINLVPAAFYVLLSIYWIIVGCLDDSPITLILGILFLVLSIVMAVTLFIQWKRNPIEDAEMDEQISRNFKEGMKGTGILYGIIAIGFIVAFTLVAIFT